MRQLQSFRALHSSQGASVRLAKALERRVEILQNEANVFSVNAITQTNYARFFDDGPSQPNRYLEVCHDSRSRDGCSAPCQRRLRASNMERSHFTEKDLGPG